MKPGHTSLALCLGSLLIACSSLPPRQQAIDAFTTEQKAAALAAQEQQRPAEALMLWRTLSPLYPGDTEIHDAIASLEDQIQQRSRQFLNRGKAAYTRGNYREGDSWMLKVLALEPGQAQALEALRISASKRAMAAASTKATQENQAMSDTAAEDAPADIE